MEEIEEEMSSAVGVMKELLADDSAVTSGTAAAMLDLSRLHLHFSIPLALFGFDLRSARVGFLNHRL